jgi:hypothetical protein
MRTLPLALAATLLLAAPANAATQTCSSKDLRYAFTEGGPKTFGIFKLRVTNGSCSTARKAAKAYKTTFEKKYKVPKQAGGFTFTELPPNAPQTYRLRGVKGTTRINFNYVVPNG